MRSTTFFIAALAIVAGGVAAQDGDPTTTDASDGADATPTSVSACFMTCAQRASTAARSCSGITDITCLCAPLSGFMDSAAQCVLNSCREEDQAAACFFLSQACTKDTIESITAGALTAVPSSECGTPMMGLATATMPPRSIPSSLVHSTPRPSASSSASASQTVYSASASNAATAVKMPSASIMTLTLGVTVLGSVLGPLLLFA